MKPPDGQDALGQLAFGIRTLRERKGFTQEELATRCGISTSFASLLERGHRAPSYETLVQVAAALETSVAELFRFVGAQSREEPQWSELADFARTHRLERAQVDKLKQLARVAFELGPDRRSAPAAPKVENPLCTVPHCGGTVLAKGLCARHYHQKRRGKLLPAK